MPDDFQPKAFLTLNGHPDSLTTNSGPVLVDFQRIEAITCWHDGSRIVTASGAVIYVEENLHRIHSAMQEISQLIAQAGE